MSSLIAKIEAVKNTFRLGSNLPAAVSKTEASYRVTLREENV